jgi:hypothetical protein
MKPANAIASLTHHLDVRRTICKLIFLQCRNAGVAYRHMPTKKGPRGMTVRPKSREETPKVGCTAPGTGPATALAWIWGYLCCTATPTRSLQSIGWKM